MEYLRVFTTQSYATEWFNKKPDLSTLLLCFDMARAHETNTPVSSVSVFRAYSHQEELQNVAALSQNSRAKAKKRFAICVTDADCAEAGVKIEQTPGNTGVSVADARHSDLNGDLGNFIKLTKVITRRIYEGENRFRTYSSHAILGEIAIFSRLEKEFDDDVRSRCKLVLEKSPGLWQFCDDRDVVEIYGTLTDKKNAGVSITATRPLRLATESDGLWHRLLRRLRMH